MRSRLLLLFLPVLLAGCLVQSKIQGRYVRDHSNCQSEAEANIDHYLPKDRPVSESDRNAELLTLFSDCMGKKGWQVAKPKRAEAGSAPLTDNGMPPTPEPAAVPVPVQQSAPPPPTQPPTQPVMPQPTVLYPGLSQPAPSPDGAAIYQPSPGRNF